MAADWIEGGGSLWRERVRALQLRIRNRFRVAVDRHRRWQEESDYSAAIRRWVDRAQSVWADHSATAAAPRSSSLKFYRKKVEKDVDAIDDSTAIRLLRALAVPVIGNACHVFMHGLNQVQIYGAEKLHRVLLERPEGKPLVTVSNHVAAVDDPFVIASLLPPSALLDARNLRWTLCATDRCFTNPMLSTFFRCVKVLPVSRGDGIYQKGMDMALSKLNNGGWVHIFPEGSRSKDGGRTMGSPKRGVGRLVMDADTAPIVIPFVHTGMQDIMPVGARVPKIGKKITVLIGDPITFDDLLVDKDGDHMSRGILYDSVSSRIGHRLQELKVQVDRLALQQPVGVQDYPMHSTERGYRIWQQVDWEGFGMEIFMLPEEDYFMRMQQHVACSQSMQNLDQPLKADPARRVRMGFSFEGGTVSRVHGHMNPTELMGFAARGLFMNGRILDESHQRIQEAGQAGLKAWKQFLEENVFPQWKSM